MQEYRVYKHPAGELVAIKKGWSWPAFFLGCFWALYKKMWGIGFGVLIAAILLYGAVGTSPNGDLILNVLNFVIAIIFGVQGNGWVELTLKQRGFDYLTFVNASTPEGAIAMYLKEQSNTIDSREPFIS